MPKAGRYGYPTRDLDDCIEALRKAYENSKSYVMTRDSFATAIGQSVKGGGFNLLVGSISMFGLAETGGGEIRYTELAKKILFGESEEIPKAKAEAVRKITLLGEIYDKYGANFTDDQLRLFLKDRAVVDIAEANSLAQTVGKLLKKHLDYLKATKVGERVPVGGGERLKDEGTESESSTEEFKLGGGIVVTLPKDNVTTAWDRAKKAIDILLGVKEKERNVETEAQNAVESSEES